MSCWIRIGIAFENSVDPDQMASEEAIWSGSTLFFHSVCEFIWTDNIKLSDWLTVRNGCGKLNLFSMIRVNILSFQERYMASLMPLQRNISPHKVVWSFSFLDWKIKVKVLDFEICQFCWLVSLEKCYIKF